MNAIAMAPRMGVNVLPDRLTIPMFDIKEYEGNNQPMKYVNDMKHENMWLTLSHGQRTTYFNVLTLRKTSN
jgi:hypothetical protein